ncbi:MAG: response regulator [Planctomycetales bacterium]|nr:response regulator [Planctomycetales bacterium]
MNDKVLLIDDDANVLQALRRGLHGKHKLFVAEGGKTGVETLKQKGPFAVIVCDMQMPELDGLEVLRIARKIAPDTIRIMLTGNADQKTAVNAVNAGAIFRFVNKPCPAETLGEILVDAIRQHQVLISERHLLSKTLTGAIALISEVMSLTNPSAFGRGNHLRLIARHMAQKLQLDDAWQYEIAAMLSQFGCLGVPQELIEKSRSGKLLSQAEESLLQSQADIGSKMIGNIPRLETVAQMISLQYRESFDPATPACVVVGAQMLRILGDYDLLSGSNSAAQAIDLMERTGNYAPQVFQEFKNQVLGTLVVRALQLRDLKEHMVLDEDVLTRNGEILIRKGHELTDTLIHRLKAFEYNAVGIRQPIRVQCKSSDLPDTMEDIKQEAVGYNENPSHLEKAKANA